MTEKPLKLELTTSNIVSSALGTSWLNHWQRKQTTLCLIKCGNKLAPKLTLITWWVNSNNFKIGFRLRFKLQSTIQNSLVIQLNYAMKFCTRSMNLKFYILPKLRKSRFLAGATIIPITNLLKTSWRSKLQLIGKSILKRRQIWWRTCCKGSVLMCQRLSTILNRRWLIGSGLHLSRIRNAQLL